VITFTAFSVGELGNKSIKAWPSPKDCVRLGSSGIEPKNGTLKLFAKASPPAFENAFVHS